MTTTLTPIELSLVVCTRNRGARLEPMLEALAAVQSKREWEVLLVDNNSTDDTWQVLQKADNLGGRLRLLQVERTGLGAGRDAAWRQARGGIVAFTDDDCYVAPDYVDAMLSVFDEQPELAGAGGRILLFDPADYPITIDEREDAVEIPPCQFVSAGAIQGANMAFRREALARIGGFDPDLGAGTPFPCEDIDVVARISWSGEAQAYDPRPLVYHHHGRKAADLPALMRGYDRGRGAYYAKFLLDPHTRRAYIAGWKAAARACPHRANLASNLREVGSAVRYLRHRRKWATIAAAVPGVAAMLLELGFTVAVRKAGRSLGRRGLAPG